MYVFVYMCVYVFVYIYVCMEHAVAIITVLRLGMYGKDTAKQEESGAQVAGQSLH